MVFSVAEIQHLNKEGKSVWLLRLCFASVSVVHLHLFKQNFKDSVAEAASYTFQYVEKNILRISKRVQMAQTVSENLLIRNTEN